MNWSSTTISFSFGAMVASGIASLLATGCAPRPRMCTASSECATQSACVAGRCQLDRPNVKPAVDAARRLVVHPVDLAYLRRGDEPASGGALPPLFTLGRDSAMLMLRFAVELPANANVVEAYVVLRRADAVDDDPTPVSLHATRIVEGWDGRSTSWARQPRVVEERAPATRVEPGGPSLVRVDVRDLVRQWKKHDPRDQGIAVVADGQTRSGSTFAFRSTSSSSELTQAEPYLELYVR